MQKFVIGLSLCKYWHNFSEIYFLCTKLKHCNRSKIHPIMSSQSYGTITFNSIFIRYRTEELKQVLSGAVKNSAIESIQIVVPTSVQVNIYLRTKKLYFQRRYNLKSNKNVIVFS